MNLDYDCSGELMGKYVLEKRLGSGSFGVVYKAKDRVMNCEKAIKILRISDPNKAFNLFNEASIPHKCQHTNIIKINSGDVLKISDEELVFVVDMDLANGKSVEELLSQGQLSIVESVEIIKEILFALEHSHLQGFIHRDIKPGNILMDRGVPKLADFGLATALGSDLNHALWYVSHKAPETYDSTDCATVATDIYAMGMTMYRMVNGIPNWSAVLNNFNETDFKNWVKSGKILNKLPWSSIVPRKVKRVITRACNVDPAKRYSSASEMRKDLDGLKLYYSWKEIGTDHWHGTAHNDKDRELFIKKVAKHFDVVVKLNNQRRSNMCSSYDSLDEAKKYMLKYIKDSILK